MCKSLETALGPRSTLPGHKPKAHRPTPGSADLCLITRTGLNEVVAHLRDRGIQIEEGPVTRTGALGPITSVYLRDPDRNLVQIGTYEGRKG